MPEKPAIKRYFDVDAERLAAVYKDLRPIVRLMNSSQGEFSLQLRENYFNIYYQGNSVAKVDLPRKDGKYVVEIHNKFLVEKPWDVIPEGFELERGVRGLEGFRCSPNKAGLPHQRFKVEGKKLAWFFQKSHLERLGRNIRRVNNGEEITFEQLVMTDNPPRSDLIIIDRQVADHTSTKQMDLLALARSDATGPFHFLILELKLGRNKELEVDVANQFNEYIDRIREHIGDYAYCYGRNYEQKWGLGLFNAPMPSRIKIDDRPESVQGLVVVGGYSQIGELAIGKLKSRHPDVRVLPMTNKLRPEDAR